MIAITYKGEEISFKLNDLLLLGDITFSIIIFIWYIIYKLGFLQDYSPLLAISLSLLQNIIILIIMILKQSSFDKIFKYLILSIVIKVIGILSFFPDRLQIQLKDVFLLIYLYVIYITIIILISEIFKTKYNIEAIIYDDLTGEGTTKTPNAKISSMTYDSLIDVIYSYGNSIAKN